MHSVPESDWKVFRRLSKDALERFCRRVLDEVEAVCSLADKSYHERYLEVYRVIHERDRELAGAFNDLRRSRMLFQLAAMVRLDLIEAEELERFSEDTRTRIGRLTS